MDRESILRRLRGLAAKTTGNGCTEEEALAAAEMVASLLDRYGFDQADLGLIEKEEIKEYPLTECGAKIGSLMGVVKAVANYCDMKVWKSSGQVVFFGRETDGLLAKHLMSSFQNAMLLGWFSYRRSLEAAATPRAKESYEIGMMGRLSTRLNQMKGARSAKVDEQTGRTGQSLVLVKTVDVDAAFKALGWKLKPARRTKGKSVEGNAYVAGQSAGDNVNITTGIAA